MNDPDTVKERFLKLCEILEITPNQFSLNIGRNRDFIRKMTGEVGSDALRNIYRTFPNINIIWIITGEGEIFIDNITSSHDKGNLTSFLKEENKELKEENKRLIKENALLSAKLELSLGLTTQDAI